MVSYTPTIHSAYSVPYNGLAYYGRTSFFQGPVIVAIAEDTVLCLLLFREFFR
jgi:hypothetical protein